jgi:hypothetical protein
MIFRLVCALFIANICYADYYRCALDHGAIMYTILEEYVDANPDVSMRDVRKYINSGALCSVLESAARDGHTCSTIKHKAMKVALKQPTKKQVIIDALQAEMADDLLAKRIFLYSTIVVMSLMVLLLPVWIVLARDYVRFKRVALAY